MSSSGRSSGGASLAYGTSAGKPGTPATTLYMSTDTGEFFVSNQANNAWLSLGGSSRSPFFAGANNFPALAFDANLTGPRIGLRNTSLISVESGPLNVHTVGDGLQVVEGANAKQGVSTLVAGTVVVANTSVTANSRIFLTPQDNNTAGALRVSARTAGTSFTILSSNGADTGVVAWEIFEPGA